MAELAVRCEKLSRFFSQGGSQVVALREVDLDVPFGELTLLVGPSGCGKTTLLSVMAGMLTPSEGRVWVLGKEIGPMSSREKIRFRGQNLGFVFQQYNLLPALTAAENVTVPLIIQGVPRSAALKKANVLLDRMKMTHRAKAMPNSLSGGEQQRVAIARALIHDPRLVVCDEPTSALDAETGLSIMDLLRSVAVESGRAVVVVTHDSRIFPFGNRVARMDDGQIVEIKTQVPSRPTHAAH